MSARLTDVRPLDGVRSIKVKLGVLVAASSTASAAVLWYGLTRLGWLPRYTLPVAVLLALGVTQLLAHGMTRPLREMTAAARAMAGGDYGRRVRATSRDEVGQLAAAFNTMSTDLAAVDGQRRALVANVSHELRTPIAALRAVLENLADGVVPADPATLRTALAQTERLGRLVDDLLDLSRVEAGVTRLDREELAVAALGKAAVAEAEHARGGDVALSFAVDVRPADLTAYADGARLHQVLANLLSNAARHSPPGGTVTLYARRTAGVTRLEVGDEGPGIPAQERDRVFERFHRASAADDGGTGLGLAIARWVVDLHGGEIDIVPTPHGCRIRVDLPAGPARGTT